MKSLKGLGTVSVLMLTAFITKAALAEVPLNGLTEAEKRSGWEVLFDGKSTDGWRNYKKEGVSDGWQVKDGVGACSRRCRRYYYRRKVRIF